MAHRILLSAKNLESRLLSSVRHKHLDAKYLKVILHFSLVFMMILCDEIVFFFFRTQLKSEILSLERTSPLFSEFLSEFRLYCEKIPKGFEKYYKKPGVSQSAEVREGAKTETKNAPSKEGEAPRAASSGTSTPGAGSQPSSSQKPPKDWNLGMFTPTGGSRGGGNRSGSGQGRPIGSGEPERDRMLLLGALGGIALVAAIAFIEMGYKEIAWKDFVNK